MTKYEEFYQALTASYESGARRVAIELQDIPDPDAMASGIFVYHLMRHMDFDPIITHGSPLAHPQNIVMSRSLKLEDIMIPHERIDTEKIDAYIFVDHSGKTSKWYEEVIQPDKLIAIIDHHDLDEEPPEGVFVDKRRVGAVSSMLAEYLQHGAKELFSNSELEQISTALLLGIRSDTRSLTRNATALDDEMHVYLREFANLQIVSNVENIDWPPEWMTLYGRAIENRTKQEMVTIASVGYVDRKKRDVIAMVADQLLTEQGIETVYAYGLHRDIDISVRTRSQTYDFKILQELFPEGNSGGKEGAGGVQIPNPFNKESFPDTFLEPQMEEQKLAQEKMIRKEIERRIFHNKL